jgi:hypothetical protein
MACSTVYSGFVLIVRCQNIGQHGEVIKTPYACRSNIKTHFCTGTLHAPLSIDTLCYITENNK